MFAGFLRSLSKTSVPRSQQIHSLRLIVQKAQTKNHINRNTIKCNSFSTVKKGDGGVGQHENVCTVPNCLSIGRLLISPYIGYFIYNESYTVAVLLVFVASLTDLADGLIARKWKSQASNIGTVLDPLADKVFVSVLYISLTSKQLIPLELTAIVILRDVTLILAAATFKYRSLSEPRNVMEIFDPRRSTIKFNPTTISKVNTFMQLTLVGSTLLSTQSTFAFIDQNILGFFWIMTGTTTILSTLSYIFSTNTYKYLN